MAKMTPIVDPREELMAAWASAMPSIPSTPCKLAAASSSIAMFTDPANTRETATSHRVALRSLEIWLGRSFTP